MAATASMVHSRIQANLVHELRKLKEFALYTELSIVVEDRKCKPDVCAYPFQEIDWKHDVIRTEEMPILAIEIVSPRQTIQDVVNKIEIYLKEGIGSCWLIIPYPRSITVYVGKGEQNFTTDSVLDKRLDLRIPLSDIFRKSKLLTLLPAIRTQHFFMAGGK